MPELAEVNAQVRYLRDRVRGWTIARAGLRGRSHCPAWPLAERPDRLQRFFEGTRIAEVSQRGKQVLLHTERGAERGTVRVHLMFQGRLSIADDPFTSSYRHHREPPMARCNTLWLETATGDRLDFHDPDYRGRVHVHEGLSAEAIPELARQGPDVLILPETHPDYRTPWTPEALQRSASRVRKSIKELLVNQRAQAGIGNTWVCEILYRAGVHPARPARDLSAAELVRIHGATQELLQAAVAAAGRYDYDTLAVYRKEQDPEGRPVQTIQIAGRDTWFVEERQT